MARIHKRGLFQIHCLFSVHGQNVWPIAYNNWQRSNNDRVHGLDTLILHLFQSMDLNKPQILSEAPLWIWAINFVQKKLKIKTKSREKVKINTDLGPSAALGCRSLVPAEYCRCPNIDHMHMTSLISWRPPFHTQTSILEVPGSSPSPAVVAPLDKALYPHCLVFRRRL